MKYIIGVILLFITFQSSFSQDTALINRHTILWEVCSPAPAVAKMYLFGAIHQIPLRVQMNGIHTVLPNDATHPEFGQALRRAAKAGVQVAFYECQVEADSIKITGVNDKQQE